MNMATGAKKGKNTKDVDRRQSRRVLDEELLRKEETVAEVVDPLPAPIIEEPVVDTPPAPAEPLPEPVYEEPILTQLIVECYEGEKVRGLYDGQGVACFVGGHRYEGQFSEGLMHGNGKYIWADGVIYEGEFTKNHITGKGKYTWTDGSTYEGDVVNGIRNGVGTLCCPQRNIVYRGDWVMGKQHGKGRLDYDEQGLSFYDGQWVHNVRHGFGVRRYPSGNIYEGTWYNNQRHGVGTMQWFDKHQSYSGNWENGVQHGMGQQIWYLRRGATTQYALRNTYDGEISHGMRHGYGIFYYANGARYEGEWKCNVKSGKGKFVFKNGRIYEGQFDDDHIAEFPTFEMDGVTTPDLSRIRTRTPLPYERTTGSVCGNESVNTFSPSFRLDIEHLIHELVEFDREDEAAQVACVVMRHMTSLHLVYLFYSRLGHDDNPDNTYVMTRMQFWRFLKDCRLHYTDYGLVDMDRWLARTPDQFEQMHNPYGQILFREFLDYLVTIAFYLNRARYPGSGQILAWCLSSLITENLLKFACNVQGALYTEVRRTANALVHMDEVFAIFGAVCSPRKHWAKFNHVRNGDYHVEIVASAATPIRTRWMNVASNRMKPEMSKKRFPPDSTLTMRQFLLMLKDMKLINKDLTAKAFINILASDDPKVIDQQGGINLELEIVFMEFFEALIQCAQVYVSDSMLDEADLLQVTTAASNAVAEQIDTATINYTGSPYSSARRDSTQEWQQESGDLAKHASSRIASGKSVLSKDGAAADQLTGESALHLESDLSQDQRQFLMDSLLMGTTSEQGRGTITTVSEESLAQSNVWSHRVHIFFVRKFIPASRLFLEVKSRTAAEKQRQQACIHVPIPAPVLVTDDQVKA